MQADDTGHVTQTPVFRRCFEVSTRRLTLLFSKAYITGNTCKILIYSLSQGFIYLSGTKYTSSRRQIEYFCRDYGGKSPYRFVFTIESWRPRGLVEDPGLPQVMIQTYQRIGLQHAYEPSVKGSVSIYLVIVDGRSCLMRI